MSFFPKVLGDNEGKDLARQVLENCGYFQVSTYCGIC